MTSMKQQETGITLRSFGARTFALSGALALAAVALAGCSSAMVDTLSISPSAQTVAVGSQVPFTATGIEGHGSGHPSTTQDVTDQVAWVSSSPAIATISSTGVATGVSAGTTTITATINGYTGLLTATATLTVTSGKSGGGSTSADITSITVIPGSQSVAAPGGTAQFIPVGNTASGITVNLAGAVTWSSSSSQIAVITTQANGTVTAVGQGSASITALYTNADGSVATGSATFQVVGTNSDLVTAMVLFPGAQALTALSQTTQFTALGTEGGQQFDVTNSPNVVWTSSDTNVAQVGTPGSGTPGQVTALGIGDATIFATYTNSNGSKVIGQAQFTASAGSAPEPLLSINIVPAGTTVSSQGMTGQYLAFGSFSTPPLVRDITNNVTWISLLPGIASINSYGAPGASGSGGASGELAGLATAEGYTGTTVIYAEDKTDNPDGTVVLSNPQPFTCKDPTTNICDPEVAVPQFATVSVFVEGENTSPAGEYVTAPSDTNTPNLIHCGPGWTGAGGQVCTGTYEVGSNLTLTENLPVGSPLFGGWSTGAAETLSCMIQTGSTTSNTCGFNDPTNPPSGWSCSTVTTGSGATASSVSTCYDPIPCTPAAGYTATNSPTCTIPLLGNATVGVIFY